MTTHTDPKKNSYKKSTNYIVVYTLYDDQCLLDLNSGDGGKGGDIDVQDFLNICQYEKFWSCLVMRLGKMHKLRS